MKAIMIMYDSLRRDLLSCYGGPFSTPNFTRLAEHTVQFDHNYVGSLPCMPARRELQTGRYNFLHRSWGPMEPFDDAMPEILKQHSIYTHIVTDHYHYIEDGGATYMGRYSSWECNRGQESDAWIADLSPKKTEFAPCLLAADKMPPFMHDMKKHAGWQNEANRKAVQKEEDFPIHETFDEGLAFLDQNSQFDNWFLQIETFDPHEPFFSPDRVQQKYMSPDQMASPDWPPYAKVHESEEEVHRMRLKYEALTCYCDEQLGRVLDKMDAYNLWEDTMLIVNTDHGFFLGEHDWWGKGSMPSYEELVHTPLFIYDPRCRCAGVHRNALVQTIDLAPTLLEYFHVEIPKDMQGIPLRTTIADDRPVRQSGIFGYHSGPIGITDGRYVLLRAVANPNTTYEYTLMPTHMKSLFTPEELKDIQLHEPFSFTKGVKVMQIEAKQQARYAAQQPLGQDLLFDLEKDPKQEHPLEDEKIKADLLTQLSQQMKASEAPEELYTRYAVPEQ